MLCIKPMSNVTFYPLKPGNAEIRTSAQRKYQNKSTVFLSSFLKRFMYLFIYLFFYGGDTVFLTIK